MQSVTLSLIMNLYIQVHLILNCQDRILFNKYITYNTRLTLSFKCTKKGTPCGVPRSFNVYDLISRSFPLSSCKPELHQS